MTRYSESLAPALGLAIVGRALRVVFRQLQAVAKARIHRQEVKLLAELDERVLKDIGLSRSDVDGALSEPFYRDPTTVLVRSYPHRSRVQRPAGVERKPVRPVVTMVSRA